MSEQDDPVVLWKCLDCKFELIVYPWAEPGLREKTIAEEHIGCSGAMVKSEA
jgi:hypothetical protein